MACSISNITVTSPGDPPTTLTISGHAVECGTVRVSVVCTVGGVPIFAEATVDPGTGDWSADLPTGAVNSLCFCGRTVTVHAECVDDPTCSVDVPVFIECPDACPAVTNLSIQPSSTCNPDGTRTVTFTVTVTDTSGSGAFFNWEYEPSVYDMGFFAPAGGSVTPITSHDYAAPGTYTATLIIISPSGCPPIEVEVDVEECPPECPELTDVTVSVATDCNADGTREVTFTFSSALTADLDFGDGSPSVGLIGSSGVTHDYTPTGPYIATLTIDDCEPLEISVGPLEECPGQTPLGACCLRNGVCVTLSHAECLAKSGTYQGDNTTCAGVNCGSGPGGGGGGGSPSGGGKPSPCGAFTYIIAGLASVALALTLILICLASVAPPWLWGFTIAAAALTAFAIGLWYFLCSIGVCVCPTKCDWLAIAWTTFLTGALVAMYLTPCCIVIPMGVVAIILLAIALAAFIPWLYICYPTKCDILSYLLIALVTGFGTTIAVFVFVSSCGLVIVSGIVAIIAAIVAVAVATCP